LIEMQTVTGTDFPAVILMRNCEFTQ